MNKDDTLDNRKSNLRICTHAENQRNRKQKDRKSYKKTIEYLTGKREMYGITTIRDRKKLYYRVQVGLCNKIIYLGSTHDLNKAKEWVLLFVKNKILKIKNTNI